MLLPLALTIPAVTEKSKLKGDPIATTQSPTLNESLSPTLTFGSLSPSIFKTARSERASTPIISATYSLLSTKETITSVAPSTTWKLVSM